MCLILLGCIQIYFYRKLFRGLLFFRTQCIFRTISTKFYENRTGFVDDMTKTFGVLLGS